FLLSTLRIRPYDRARKTRSRRGWLGLRRTTLSFAASCRIRCRRLCLLHQLWWCKDAAYGIGLTLRHSTPERVLHGNFRLPCANLLKRGQLRKKPADQGAVEQPEVSAGELVDS